MITAKLERLALVDALRRRRVSLHWTSVFGVAALASLLVLIVTGVVLTFFYAPSSGRVVYAGGYGPLHGAEVSRAFASTIGISFDVRGGLLIRQLHHWAALLLPAAIIGQLLVTFFTGAFRGRRVWGWVLLFLSLIAALAAGWSGYALPDDLLSGTGLRIVEGIVLGIPFAGTWIAALLFGGGFPGRIIENLWIVHLVASVALVALAVGRLRRRPSAPLAFRGVDVVELRAGGARFVGRAAAAVTGLLVAAAATVTISPVWLYGPSDPGNVSAGSQPDWYTGFLDGALRLVPAGWEVEIGGSTLTLAVLVPLAVVGGFLGAVLVYPFVENAVRPASVEPGLLDRPRDVPNRTALGVAGMTFYGVLWGAASADLLAHLLRLSLEGVLVFFQVLLVAGPVLAFVVAQRTCLGLQRRDLAVLAHGYETGRIVRMPGGEYVEVHATPRTAPVVGGYEPVVLRPDSGGRIRVRARVRALVSRVLFGERVAPVTGSVGTGASVRDAA